MEKGASRVNDDASDRPGRVQKSAKKSSKAVAAPNKAKLVRGVPRYGHSVGSSDAEKRKIERNLLLQFDEAMQMVEAAVNGLADPDNYKLTVETLNELNRIATENIVPEPGVLRRRGIRIGNSKHTPPAWEYVEGLMNEMCDYVNSHWKNSTPIHLASYVLWRLNWIHPYSEGNGRTSRMASYLVLCIRLGFRLPGTSTIPEQIATNRQPYYSCLDSADAAFRDGKIDVSEMETLLEGLLAKQLVAVVESASGKPIC